MYLDKENHRQPCYPRGNEIRYEKQRNIDQTRKTW